MFFKCIVSSSFLMDYNLQSIEARGRPRHCSILHVVNIAMALPVFHNRFLVSQSAQRLFYTNEHISGNLCRGTRFMCGYNTQTLLLKSMDNFKRESKLIGRFMYLDQILTTFVLYVQSQCR